MTPKAGEEMPAAEAEESIEDAAEDQAKTADQEVAAQPKINRYDSVDPFIYDSDKPETWLTTQAAVGSLSLEQMAPTAQPSYVPEPPPLRPQVIHRTYNVESGLMRLEWVVSQRKLTSDDKSAVSPAFDLSFGEAYPSVHFKMMIHPKVIDESKGGGSFKTANGRGYVQLACEDVLPTSAPEVSFCVTIGTGEKRQPLRGPVSHNFSEKKVCGLPKDKALWNFNSVVDKESKTFVVCLELLARSTDSGEAISNAGGNAQPSSGPKRW